MDVKVTGIIFFITGFILYLSIFHLDVLVDILFVYVLPFLLKEIYLKAINNCYVSMKI